MENNNIQRQITVYCFSEQNGIMQYICCNWLKYDISSYNVTVK